MNVIRIQIMQNGPLLLDGKPSTIADVRAAVERAKEGKLAVWYYRENADAPATDSQMEALKIITDAGVPVSLSTKADFSDYVGEDGRSRPRAVPQVLQRYEFFRPPNTPAVGILRLDTKTEQQWFLVSRNILLNLSAELARMADKLEAVQPPS